MPNRAPITMFLMIFRGFLNFTVPVTCLPPPWVPLPGRPPFLYKFYIFAFCPLLAPSWQQHGSNMDGAKKGQHAAKMGQHGSKMAQHGAKIGQHGSHFGGSWGQDGPTWRQEGFKNETRGKNQSSDPPIRASILRGFSNHVGTMLTHVALQERMGTTSCELVKQGLDLTPQLEGMLAPKIQQKWIWKTIKK